jgi:hypothetical protein
MSSQPRPITRLCAPRPADSQHWKTEHNESGYLRAGAGHR